MTETAPPDLSVKRIKELQAQCRNAFDLPQIRLSELSALLSAYRVRSLAHSAASGSEWRPIESAPKDGTTVLLVRVYGEPPYTMGTGHFGLLHPSAPSLQPLAPDPLGRVIPDLRSPGWATSKKWLRDDCIYLFPTPTHWQPLPPPPTKKEPETNV